MVQLPPDGSVSEEINDYWVFTKDYDCIDVNAPSAHSCQVSDPLNIPESIYISMDPNSVNNIRRTENTGITSLYRSYSSGYRDYIVTLRGDLPYRSTFSTDISPVISSIHANNLSLLVYTHEFPNTFPILECTVYEVNTDTTCTYSYNQDYIFQNLEDFPAPPEIIEGLDPLANSELMHGEYTVKLLNYFLNKMGLAEL